MYQRQHRKHQIQRVVDKFRQVMMKDQGMKAADIVLFHLDRLHRASIMYS